MAGGVPAAAQVDEFRIDVVKRQHAWGWLVISYLFLGGAGAGAFLAALALRLPWGEVLGLGLLVVATGFLFLDLGRPERFWRAFLRPRTSWISRGAISITALVAVGGLHLAAVGAGLDGSPPERVLAGAAAVAAFAVMVYTGFLLSPSPAIPFWNSTFFPAIFFAYSLLAGIDVLILASLALSDQSVDLALLEAVQFGLVAGCLLMVLSHLSVMSHAGLAARSSIALLIRGNLRRLFLGGVLGAGLLVPLAVAAPSVLLGGPAVVALSAILAVLRLVGDYLFRFLVIRAGSYDPVR
jgi:formate-dependent nitrite reductase membrane component NrfD